jgi:hypothetical protein
MAIKKKSPELEAKFKTLNEDFVKNMSSLTYYANNFYYFRVSFMCCELDKKVNFLLDSRHSAFIYAPI